MAKPYKVPKQSRFLSVLAGAAQAYPQILQLQQEAEEKKQLSLFRKASAEQAVKTAELAEKRYALQLRQYEEEEGREVAKAKALAITKKETAIETETRAEETKIRAEERAEKKDVTKFLREQASPFEKSLETAQKMATLEKTLQATDIAKEEVQLNKEALELRKEQWTYEKWHDNLLMIERKAAREYSSELQWAMAEWRAALQKAKDATELNPVVKAVLAEKIKGSNYLMLAAMVTNKSKYIDAANEKFKEMEGFLKRLGVEYKAPEITEDHWWRSGGYKADEFFLEEPNIRYDIPLRPVSAGAAISKSPVVITPEERIQNRTQASDIITGYRAKGKKTLSDAERQSIVNRGLEEFLEVIIDAIK